MKRLLLLFLITAPSYGMLAELKKKFGTMQRLLKLRQSLFFAKATEDEAKKR